MNLLFVVIGCLTPTWPYEGLAPGAQAPWNAPSDEICEQRDDPIARVDDTLWCGAVAAENKIAVLDPIFERCDRAAPNGAVLAVFDGVLARGYPLAELDDREVVNDWWRGEPLLVDY